MLLDQHSDVVIAFWAWRSLTIFEADKTRNLSLWNTEVAAEIYTSKQILGF